MARMHKEDKWILAIVAWDIGISAGVIAMIEVIKLLA